jgi:hypothetical protein
MKFIQLMNGRVLNVDHIVWVSPLLDPAGGYPRNSTFDILLTSGVRLPVRDATDIGRNFPGVDYCCRKWLLAELGVAPSTECDFM